MDWTLFVNICSNGYFYTYSFVITLFFHSHLFVITSNYMHHFFISQLFTSMLTSAVFHDTNFFIAFAGNCQS